MTIANQSGSSQKHQAHPTDAKVFQREQIAIMQQELPLVLLADIVAAFYLFAILFSQHQSPYSWIWVATLALVSVSRGIIVRRLKRSQSTSDSLRWRFFVFGAILSGLIWGNAWVLLPPNPEFIQVTTVGVWLAGMLAGAASTLAVSKRTFLAYSIPAFTCFAAYILLQSMESKFVLAGGALLFFAFILPIAFRINRSFSKTISLQSHNLSLTEHLERKADHLALKERELAEQIKRSALWESETISANNSLEDEARQKLLILNAISEGIFGLDTNGHIIYTNESATQILGIDETEILNKSINDFLFGSSDDSEETGRARFAVSNSCQLGITAHGIESQFTGRNLMPVPVKFSCTPIWQAGMIQGSVISFLDISKQKEMEAMLLQSHKMEAIAALTGGVAHDFNNLLTIMLGNLQFLRRRIKDDDKAEEIISTLIAEAKRGGELNNRLLSFSSEQNQEKELISVNDMLTEMKYFLDRMLGDSISLNLSLPEEEIYVATDKTQLQNAVLNLCNNAKDAMPRGGAIVMSASTLRLARSFINSDASRGEAEYVEICITDNGIGIPLADQRKVFDPFFTTKTKNQDTGLGLATVYSFIRRSNGNITVSSTEGKWTKFRIYLPLVKPEIKEEAPTAQLTKRRPQSDRVVLVVEDDAGVRDVAIEALRESGFQIIAASNGDDGLAEFSNHPEIRVVFSDVIMPGGINGIQMAESMLSERPDTQIVLVTGYTDKALRQKIEKHANVIFLSKPYDVDALPRLLESTMLL